MTPEDDAPRPAELRERAGPDSITLHASAVTLNDRGFLITGDPGAGKSQLAAEMLALGAGLVADDWVVIERGRAVGLVMSAPGPIQGLLELRGIGLVRVPFVDQAPLTAIVDLNREPMGRLPHPQHRGLLGIDCPVICAKGRAGLAAALMAVLRAGGLLDPEFFSR
jgi:HPr kinase/phosphorylase